MEENVNRLPFELFNDTVHNVHVYGTQLPLLVVLQMPPNSWPLLMITKCVQDFIRTGKREFVHCSQFACITQLTTHTFILWIISSYTWPNKLITLHYQPGLWYQLQTDLLQSFKSKRHRMSNDNEISQLYSIFRYLFFVLSYHFNATKIFRSIWRLIGSLVLVKLLILILMVVWMATAATSNGHGDGFSFCALSIYALVSRLTRGSRLVECTFLCKTWTNKLCWSEINDIALIGAIKNSVATTISSVVRAIDQSLQL